VIADAKDSVGYGEWRGKSGGTASVRGGAERDGEGRRETGSTEIGPSIDRTLRLFPGAGVGYSGRCTGRWMVGGQSGSRSTGQAGPARAGSRRRLDLPPPEGPVVARTPVSALLVAEAQLPLKLHLQHREQLAIIIAGDHKRYAAAASTVAGGGGGDPG
jgi:hypothetical protein